MNSRGYSLVCNCQSHIFISVSTLCYYIKVPPSLLSQCNKHMSFPSNLWVGHVFLSLYVVLLERVTVFIAMIQYLAKAIQEGKLLLAHSLRVHSPSWWEGQGRWNWGQLVTAHLPSGHTERRLPIYFFLLFILALGQSHPHTVKPFCKNAHRCTQRYVSMVTLNSIKLTMKISQHSCDIRVPGRFELGVGVATSFFLCRLLCITTDFLRT